MSRETIKQLYNIGARTIDISGTGGTNFAIIENHRRKGKEYSYIEDLGQSTVISLLESQEYINHVDIISSGGVRNPLDIVKSLGLGGKAAGLSGFFLKEILENGVESTIEIINNWKEEIKAIMTILGCRTIPELLNTDILVGGNVKDWCEAREISYKTLANRNRLR